MTDFVAVFGASVSGATVTTSVNASGQVVTTYLDANGVFLGRTIATSVQNKTTVEYFDSGMDLMGSIRSSLSGNVTTVETLNPFGQLISAAKITEKNDFTLTEQFDSNWTRLGAVKEIHTDTTTGKQVYDASYNLLSAHLETDDGLGRTTVEEYGPNWFLIAKTTVTVTDDRVVTEHQANGAGNVTGGTIVTTKADHTLTETFGPNWVLTGAVKEIHTATATGTQVYDANYNLVSAHLETNDGIGRTTVEDYGPNWFLIAKTTVTVTEDRVVTEHQANGAGNVTGGTIVTTKADFTLTESFGPNWVLTGAIKEIHTATATGTQVYDANYNLVSAHLETNDGLGRTTVEDYGANWFLVAKTTVTVTEDRVITEHQANGAGNVTGGTIVTTKADFTLTESFGANWVLTGAVKEIHTATATGTQVYDANYTLVSAHLETNDGLGRTTVEDYGPNWFLVAKTTVTVTEDRVITEHQANGSVTGGTIVTTKPDFTLTESFGANWVLSGAVKEIHTATATGTQVYDANYDLVSAHLETNDGFGRTTVEDYGPNWFLIAKTTVTVTDDRVITEHQANGAGNITGGTIVTTKADFTLTESFGANWVLTGAVKDIHTATATGTQVYDANYNLVSAHLETNDGLGRTTVEDYGPNWFLIAKTTVTVTDDRVITEHQANGNVTGGTIVTARRDFTLTETFGANWVLVGAVKEIHTATVVGTQVYDSGFKLLSAHLETDNGAGQTKVEDYGKDWALVSRTIVTVSGEKTVTEHQEGSAGTVLWMTSNVGHGVDAATTHTGYGADNLFVGDIGQDLMYGGGGNDTLYGEGNSDELRGGEGNDTLFGGAGDDKLLGENGNDKLFGGSGHDTLNGGAGTDMLVGGSGRDIMYGGAAADKFVFEGIEDSGIDKQSRDQIRDFVAGTDKIDLKGLAAASGVASLSFVAAKGAAFTGHAGEVTWRQEDLSGTASDLTIFEVDSNGDGNADFAVQLTGLHTLNQNDFILS